VTDLGTNGKPICDFPLMVNTNLHHISDRFEVTEDFCSSLVRKTVTLRVSALWRLRGNVGLGLSGSS